MVFFCLPPLWLQIDVKMTWIKYFKFFITKRVVLLICRKRNMNNSVQICCFSSHYPGIIWASWCMPWCYMLWPTHTALLPVYSDRSPNGSLWKGSHRHSTYQHIVSQGDTVFYSKTVAILSYLLQHMWRVQVLFSSTC